MLTCQTLKGSTNATMMNHPRRQLPPVASNKRKEREIFDFLKPSTKLAKPSIHKAATPQKKTTVSKPPEPAPSNQLLAGYLAHEFLTKGTLFGQPWDPARAEAVPVSAASTDLRRTVKPFHSSSSQKVKAEPNSKKSEAQVEKHQRYVEAADLLKGNGPHLPGIVNPTQLARFLHLH